MKKFLPNIATSLGLVLMGLWLFMPASTPSSPPMPAAELMAEPHNIDLGVIEPDQTKSASFTLTNSSQSMLLLLEPTSSCGCASVKMGKSILLPGEKTEVSAEILVDNVDVNVLVSILVPYQVEAQAPTKYVNLHVKYESVSSDHSLFKESQ